VIPDRPSAYLKDALGKLGGLRLLVCAYKDGTLAEPFSMEREINRAEASVAYCLGLLAGDPPPDARDSVVPCVDNDPVLAHHLSVCESCED
jgi:hypothetical protein